MIKPVSIERVETYSDEVAAGIGQVMPYLSDRYDGKPVDEHHLRNTIEAPFSEQFVARMGLTIVGVANINVLETSTDTKAYLDNFATHGDYRGQGVGSALWEKVVEWAKDQNASQICFTSNDNREDAHSFYISKGAEVKPTTYFSLALD